MARFLFISQIILNIAFLVLPVSALAAPLSTTHYRLDPDVVASFGGQGSSTDYNLLAAGGEAALGLGSSSSYRLGSGYIRELTHSVQIAVLPSGMSLYYPFDTGVGIQAYDSGAAGNNGILQNTPTWVAGQIGQALSLNGSNQYVSSTIQTASPSPFSLELWFKTGTASGGQLAGFGSSQTGASANSDRHLYMTTSGQLVFGVNPGAYKTIISPASYNDNSWHLAAATFGSAGMALYVDGVVVGTDTNTSAHVGTGYWRFGYDNLTGWPSAPTSNFFAGKLDEAKIYSRALGAPEVANEYNAGAAGIVSVQTVPQIIPGISQTAAADIVIRTDAGGYNLAVNEDHDLRHTDGTTLIPGISAGSIAAPVTWSEGTTKGFGYSLISGNNLPVKWGLNPNYAYAALSTTPSTFYTRTGLSGNAPDTTTMQFRLDTTVSQKSGKYSNQVVVSATIIP